MLKSKDVGVWRAVKCKNTLPTISKFINFNATREITDLCCWIRMLLNTRTTITGLFVIVKRQEFNIFDDIIFFILPVLYILGDLED